MQTSNPTGSIGSSGLPDLLLSLRAAASTGRLRLEREGLTRDLWLRDGRVIGAESSAGTDSIEWLLLTAGVLDEDGHRAVRAMIQSGVKRGRALIETGGISPSVLCEWTERRTRFLTRDLLSWTSGAYRFEPGDEPPPGSITVALDPGEVLLEALRDGAAARLLSESMPSPDAVIEPIGSMSSGAQLLNAAERYVLSLVDGHRCVAEICSLSEIGETDTLGLLALLAAAGCLGGSGGSAGRVLTGCEEAAGGGVEKEPEPRPLEVPGGDKTSDLRGAIRVYNEVFVFLYAYMIKEVGPIAEQLLEKTLRDVRDRHASLFARLVTCRDGSLPDDTLVRNVNLLKDDRRTALIAALHDYLIALTLAVRRILGPEHEECVLRRLREMRCSRT